MRTSHEDPLSALKHGVDPDDALIAASDPVYVANLDEDSPARQFRLGFDSTGRLLELAHGGPKPRSVEPVG